MKLTRNIIFTLIIIFGLIVSQLIAYNVQILYLRPVLTFIFLIFIPGFIISLVLKIRKVKFWEYLLYCIGFSITLLMFGGLLANWALPLIGINNPLSLRPISAFLYFLMSEIGVIAYLRSKDLLIQIKLRNLSVLNWLLFLIPIVFPILSIFGAISINNGGSNIFTMIMLGNIALYVLFVSLVNKKVNSNVFPFSLYFIAASLLLMTSLRGWYITGHDIQREYYVFQLTKNIFRWDINMFQNTYNACLSLNILPTIFSSFVNINDMYIYKILFQLIFPLTVIDIYILVKRYTNVRISFLSAFFFASCPTFMHDMSMLNRQEISLLFFAMMILVLFNKTIDQKLKNIMFLIFGLSMVVSHYSTSYIALAIFILTYIISLFFKYNLIKKNKFTNNKRFYLNRFVITGIFIFTFYWNSQLTRTSNGLTQLISDTWQNISKSFSQDLKSADVMYSIFNWEKIDKAKLFKEYVSEETKNIEIKNDPYTYFEKEIINKYKITYLEDPIKPLNRFGKILNRIYINSFVLNYILKQGMAKLVQLLLIIGFLYLLFKKTRFVRAIDPEYLILSFVSILFIGIFILLPMFSIEYGTLRFFQQTLIILSLPTIVGSLVLFGFLKKYIASFFSLCFFIIFFLSLSGFIPELTGNFYPLLNLNNQGIYYDAFYSHKSELIATSWFKKYFKDLYPVQSSLDADSKLLSFAGFGVLETILPISVEKDAYVFLDYSIVKNHTSLIYYKGNSYFYNYPINFLNDNKNIIYNNSQVQIFK
jgi:uncharacterized membrane protein